MSENAVKSHKEEIVLQKKDLENYAKLAPDLELAKQRLQQEKTSIEKSVEDWKVKCDTTEKKEKIAQDLLQQAQASEERLKIQIKEQGDLVQRLKFRVGSTNRDSDVVDLTNFDPGTAISRIPFDVEIPLQARIVAGIRELESPGESLGVAVEPDTAQTSSTTELVLKTHRNIRVPNFKVNWMAFSGFDEDFFLESVTLDMVLPASTSANKSISKSIPENYNCCYFVTWIQTLAAEPKKSIGLCLSVLCKEATLIIKNTGELATNCFEKSVIHFIAYNPTKRIQTGYILDDKKGDTEHEFNINFHHGPVFTQTPTIFIALNAFGGCTPASLRFKARVLSANKDKMVVRTEKDRSDAGPQFITYLWIAVE